MRTLRCAGRPRRRSRLADRIPQLPLLRSSRARARVPLARDAVASGEGGGACGAAGPHRHAAELTGLNALAGRVAPLLLYLDQNYLSGIAKRKPAFHELEPVLRAAVGRRAVPCPRGRHTGSSRRRDRTFRCSSCCESSRTVDGCPTSRGRRTGATEAGSLGRSSTSSRSGTRGRVTGSICSLWRSPCRAAHS